ncbi:MULTISPECIES: DUF364 domain-containing protein [Pseudomonadota]|uniref:Heavy-metal chelation domain-containing protein n=1 Tax=Stutzerimonas stutzeri NF13 TaxID=1212548 RepID=M2VQX8_STUST|nr:MULTISPECIES: DUF364 domain-containing protein [Pseudomonadota]WOF80115.1 DUF364 domain-containing protein [Pseudomonas sp. FeN3W]EME02019.1 hypothetical protein B381_01320 [Stutzerimonas stutzeri NF13]MBC2732631.1 DUF364 domain-containing protein [Thiobacillus sp.]MBC2741368.1 DUF364 domain-containing protein [Thiobacillus sp.]MBK3880471.1 hypothetical protein [Stutzerimonas stutzeri]
MNELYDWLLASAAQARRVEHLCLGLNWTLAEVDGSQGFAFSPRQVPRTLDWSGTLAGQDNAALLPWLLSWNDAEAAIGLAVLNASVNTPDGCQREALALRSAAPGHLRVFAHFRARLAGKRVVVIGHYSGLERLWQDQPYRCLERHLQEGDLPDCAAEYLLPEADWVFVSASSIANKTLPRLLELSRQARVVLMGPSLPWLEGWRRFGVDYLAGVRVVDPDGARRVVAEGGGTRLFAGPVEYALMAFGE